MDRRRVLIIGILVVAVLVLFNPFGRRPRKVPAPAMPREQLAPLKEHVLAYGKNPERYVTEAFERHSIVFLGGIGDSTLVRQQVELVSRLVPELHGSGIRAIGIEQALYDDQQAIDRLVTADSFDEREAQRLLFRRHVMWGYQEYVEIFRAAWRVNSTLEEGKQPFRIVGLSPRNEWRHLEKQKDLENEVLKNRILAQGLPSVFMADVIEREFVDAGFKALVYCTVPHVFTDYRNKRYEENTRDSGFDEARSAGNIIHDQIGGEAVTILLHYPWPEEKSMFRVGRPFGGAVDALIESLPENRRQAGFDTAGTPFADLPVNRGVYAHGYEDLRMKDLCDGYLIDGHVHRYEMVTPIEGFINESNVSEAMTNFPAPKNSLPSDKDPAEAAAVMNEMIGRYSENTRRMLDLFAF